MTPGDEKFIIVDANVWLKGLVCYEHVGVVHGSDSPTISKFLEKNRQKLLAPAAARGEVRRNLGMVQVGDRPPEYDSNAKNILRKLCKDAGCPELRRELSVRTWNTFKEYTRGRNQHKYIRGNDKKQLPGRVDEIWKMFEYIFYNDYEKYYTYSIRKSSNMGGKDISPCRTPKGHKRNKDWEDWYPPPGDIDIIAVADWFAEKFGCRVGIISFDGDFVLFFGCIEKGLFDDTPYGERPICKVRFFTSDMIESSIG